MSAAVRAASAPAAPRPCTYGPEILEPLKIVCSTLNGPAGKRLALFMAEIVEVWSAPVSSG